MCAKIAGGASNSACRSGDGRQATQVQNEGTATQITYNSFNSNVNPSDSSFLDKKKNNDIICAIFLICGEPSDKTPDTQTGEVDQTERKPTRRDPRPNETQQPQDTRRDNGTESRPRPKPKPPTKPKPPSRTTGTGASIFIIPIIVAIICKFKDSCD